MHDNNARKSLEVSYVEGQNMGDVMHHHGSDKLGVVDVDSFDLMGKDKLSPLWINGWYFRQNCKNALQLGYFLSG
jgi:hypothetical protein